MALVVGAGTALVVGEPPVFGMADLPTTAGTMGGGVTEDGGDL